MSKVNPEVRRSVSPQLKAGIMHPLPNHAQRRRLSRSRGEQTGSDGAKQTDALMAGEGCRWLGARTHALGPSHARHGNRRFRLSTRILQKKQKPSKEGGGRLENPESCLHSQDTVVILL